MTDEHLLYQVKDNIAHITINREAQRNALSVGAVFLFHDFLDLALEDEEVRVVCITGAGEKAFCSGADLGGGVNKESMAAFQRYADLMKKLASFSKPTVARVNGYCLAGGNGLMLGCDIVIARDDAKFGTPEVNVGLFPMMIGALIFRNVLQKKAMEMVLLGQRLTASQALDMGLVTRVVPAEKLDEDVNQVLESLASKSPIGMKMGKEAYHRMRDMPLEEALNYLSDRFADITATEDAKEGITAFLEKRAPVFRGR
jgi:enoyl-CoA hydratase/carnithine racemase